MVIADYILQMIKLFKLRDILHKRFVYKVYIFYVAIAISIVWRFVMKLYIAVCEDDALEQTRMKHFVNKSSFDVEIDFFQSAELFLEKFVPGKYDLLVMDILLGNMTGIDATKKVRTIDTEVPVVFTTSSLAYALEGYRLGVLKYIEKPVKLEDVEDMLQLAIKLKHKVTTLDIQNDNSNFDSDENNIMYIEQDGHNVTFYHKNGNHYSQRQKLDDVEEKISSDYFFRSHKSFLVNLRFVKSIDKDLMVFRMSDGSNAYIKRELVKEAIKRFEALM